MEPLTRAGPIRCPILLRVAHAFTLSSLAWGTLAFGAVYPWAFWPLAASAQLAGIAGLLVERRSGTGASRVLCVALMVFALAVLAQLVPLPIRILMAVSATTVETLQQLDAAMAAGVTRMHPLSIQPTATWIGLALFASFALLMLGTSRWLHRTGPTRLLEHLTVFGTVLALIGIIQQALYSGKIYGFWTPRFAGSPFGPFVNKNHFAGWMLMAIPLALGLLCAGIARAMRGVKPDWRSRLLWFASRGASKLLLVGSAIAVMALSLVLTMSRSGISALALAIALTGWFLITGRSSAARRAAGTAYLVVLVTVVTGWAGADAIVTRFSQADWVEIDQRRGAWKDAASIASAFPIAGTGLNTYGYATLLFQRYDREHHYAEAHNDYLQLAAEGGWLLCVPALWCVLLLARDVRRRLREDAECTSYWVRAGAITALVAIGLQETVDFSLQMPGNAALFAVVCAVALHRTPSRAAAGRSVESRTT